MASRQRRELNSAEWENLCVLLQRARYEGRVSEALMEANVVAPSQLPLRPASKTKAKAKPKARQMVFNGGHAAFSEAASTTETGAMTDASKRLAPDGGLTAADLPEDVAEELLELPEDFMDGFAVVEEPLPFPEMAWLGGMVHPPAIPLHHLPSKPGTGPFAGFLQRVFWEPPVPETQGYVRTFSTQ